jgi:hypothetical protein
MPAISKWNAIGRDNLLQQEADTASPKEISDGVPWVAILFFSMKSYSSLG